jgi:hypothetical protein
MTLQARRMLIKYYTRQVLGRLPGAVPIIIFCLSFFIFAALFVPPVGRWVRESPLSRRAEHRLCVRGVTTRMVTMPAGSVAEEPVGGTVVEVGGFRTTADSAGRYELLFLSESRTGIPVVFRLGKREIIRRVDYGVEQDVAYEDATFR